MTVCQDKLPSLKVLVVEIEFAKNTNYDGVTNVSALKKTRKETI